MSSGNGETLPSFRSLEGMLFPPLPDVEVFPLLCPDSPNFGISGVGLSRKSSPEPPQSTLGRPHRLRRRGSGRSPHKRRPGCCRSPGAPTEKFPLVNDDLRTSSGNVFPVPPRKSPHCRAGPQYTPSFGDISPLASEHRVGTATLSPLWPRERRAPARQSSFPA